MLSYPKSVSRTVLHTGVTDQIKRETVRDEQTALGSEGRDLFFKMLKIHIKIWFCYLNIIKISK